MLELIAEYIDKLDTAAEDRLLTTKLVPNEISTEDGLAGCLVGVATGASKEWVNTITCEAPQWWPSVMGLNGNSLFSQFNDACKKAPVKTTEFIRNRILENRFAKLPKKELACQFVSQ